LNKGLVVLYLAEIMIFPKLSVACRLNQSLKNAILRINWAARPAFDFSGNMGRKKLR
jgi:hypothetical protein